MKSNKSKYTVIVYALCDNKDKVFYIGCTVTDMETRFKAHIAKAKMYPETKCLKRIVKLNFEISYRILYSPDKKYKYRRTARRIAEKHEKVEIEKCLRNKIKLYNTVHINRIKNELINQIVIN